MGDALLGNVKNCVNKGSININKTGDDPGNSVVGGIVGTGTMFSVFESYNLGDIRTCHGIVGRIIGMLASSGNVRRCYNAGSIRLKDSWTTEDGVGGILGYSVENSNVYDCYNVGEISFSDEVHGGIVAGISGSPNSHSYTSYNAGKIKAPLYEIRGVVNGLSYEIGKKPDPSVFDLSNSNDLGEEANGINMSLKLNEEDFGNFDFEEIWIIDKNLNGTYPQLSVLLKAIIKCL